MEYAMDMEYAVEMSRWNGNDLMECAIDGRHNPQISCDPLDKSINLTLHLKVALNSIICVIDQY